MTTPPADLGYIEIQFRDAAQTLLEAYAEKQSPPTVRDTPPAGLAESIERLLALLRTVEDGPTPPDGTEENDFRALGNYGLHLLADTAAWAQALHLPHPLLKLQKAMVALALWIVRNGGEISALEPVVDALAHVANQIKQPSELKRLFMSVNDLLEGVAPTATEDADRHNPTRPWRILLLNRAIIATRSHQPALMEQAFKSLVELIPEDAEGFFAEGMEQMDVLNYPTPVRAVMEKYFQLWCKPRTLH